MPSAVNRKDPFADQAAEKLSAKSPHGLEQNLSLFDAFIGFHR
jgi:hypothetical protein